jgi:dynein heavy chain
MYRVYTEIYNGHLNHSVYHVQVMDDNKMLTLASNERIPLTGTMRLLLEINHMNHCSPATVSRGGVVFMNAEDVGWRPPVESWMSSLEVTEYRPLLSALFDRYADASMDHCRKCAPLLY